MRKFFFMALPAFLAINIASACTTFFLAKNGQLAFGRNYDWLTDAGMVCTNLRGLSKTSMKMPEGASITWVSKYGSITFNQYGKEFPMGGMNETGLVVEMMWLDGSQYPKPDKRPALYVLQWIQYQLDNSASVKEVIASNKRIRISPQANPPIHYLVADSYGDAATIEFLDGRMVVHKGSKLPTPVLANTAYATSSRLVMDVDISDTARANISSSYSDNSVKRFASACAMVKHYQETDVAKPIVDYSFDILNQVSQPEFTKWSIVYDVSNKRIFFKTASFSEIKSVSFDSFDFSCNATPLAFDMNQAASAEVSKQFVTFTDGMNSKVMSKAVSESRDQVPFKDEDIKRTVAYASAITCSK